MATNSSSEMRPNADAAGPPAQVATTAGRSTKETVALAARVVVGLIGVIAVVEIIGSFAALETERNSCAPVLSLFVSDSTCNWTTVLAYAGVMGAVVALAVPVAALGVQGMRGARIIVAGAPFTILAVLGVGLLVLNLGPLAALLTHENAPGFLIAVAMLVVGLPPTVVFAKRLWSMHKGKAGQDLGTPAT